MPKLNRVYHHYEKLEEYHAGMWRISNGEKRKSFMRSAAALMKDPARFRAAMIQAIGAWPLSCEHNFTADSINKIAWLGHAGCCVATGSPEEATRAAWHTLNQAEQDDANRVAAEALATWRAAPALVDQMVLPWL